MNDTIITEKDYYNLIEQLDQQKQQIAQLEALHDAHSEQAHHAVISALESLVFKFAGQMRTPLLGIESGLRGILHHLGHILDGYRLAVAQDLIEQDITNMQLSALASALENLIPQTRDCHRIIDEEVATIKQRREEIDGDESAEDT